MEPPVSGPFLAIRFPIQGLSSYQNVRANPRFHFAGIAPISHTSDSGTQLNFDDFMAGAGFRNTSCGVRACDPRVLEPRCPCDSAYVSHREWPEYNPEGQNFVVRKHSEFVSVGNCLKWEPSRVVTGLAAAHLYSFEQVVHV